MANKTISNTFTVNTIEDGTSPYIADLDNEMDAIACNNVGTPLTVGSPAANQSVTTTVSMWYGAIALNNTTIYVYDNNDSSSANAYTSGTQKSTGITVTWNNSTGVITATFAPQYQGSNVTLPEKKVFCIKIVSQNVDNTGNVTKYLYFTVNCMRGSAVYQIVPSTNTITKHSDGSYTPTGSGNITCTVTKTMNGTTSTAPNGEYTLKMIVDNGNEIPYTVKRIDTITSKIQYILYVPQGGSYIIDRETVPVLTDGNDGDDAHEVNPNILVDTLEYKNDKSQWFSLKSILYGSLYNGHKVRYSDYSDRETNTNYARTAEQVVYSDNNGTIMRLSPDTWYTLSVYCKGAYGTLRLSLLQAGNYITNTIKIDGVDTTITTPSATQDVGAGFDLTNTWTRHSFSFKTKSSFTRTYTTYASIRLFGNPLSSSAYMYISMPKLEVGEYPTAYMANEEDLKGADGQNGVDGANGSDAAIAFVSPDSISIACNKNGQVINSVTNQVLAFSMKVGEHSVSSENISVSVYNNTLPTGVTIANGDNNYQKKVSVSTSATDTGMKAGVVFTVQGTYGSKTYTAYVTLALNGIRQGADGSKGKVGRAYFYDGEWNEKANNYSIVVSSSQAPFYGYTNGSNEYGYYVFDPDEDGTYTKSSIINTYGNPTANNAPWSKMDKFEYIISKAIFSEYAKFGSAIINKDWMYSALGKINVGWYTNKEISTVATSYSEAGTMRFATFDAKVSGIHKITITYNINNSYLYYWVYCTNTSSVATDTYGNSVSGSVSSGSTLTLNPVLTAGKTYRLAFGKYSSSYPNPTIVKCVMDAPSNNYLYFDPATGGGEKSVLVRYDGNISTSEIEVARNITLQTGGSYQMFFSYIGSGIYRIRIIDANGTQYWSNNVNWGSHSEYSEQNANIGISATRNDYRIMVTGQSGTTTLGNVSISAGAMFAPNYAVDLYKGVSFMNDTVVKGIVYANAIYHNLTEISVASTEYKYLQPDCGDVVIINYNRTSEHNPTASLYLPNAWEMDGRIINLYFKAQNSASALSGSPCVIYAPQATPFYNTHAGTTQTSNGFYNGKITLFSKNGYWYDLTERA